MKRILQSSLIFLLAASSALSAEEVVKDNFDSQKDGQNLDALENWKYIPAWIKPDAGKIVAEGDNKFLRLNGDVFVKKQVVLDDKLTYRFQVRATGDNAEVGGLALRTSNCKMEYNILFAYRHGNISLNENSGGKSREIATGAGLVNNTFQDVVVTVEKEAAGVKFTVTIDGAPVFDAEDSEDASILSGSFTAGFFTYNKTTIDFDSVDFTNGQ